MAVGGTLWLTEKFPGRAKTDAADAYEQVWLGYESAFETILAAWDEVSSSGRFEFTLMIVLYVLKLRS